LLSKDKQKMWPTEFYLFYIFILFSLSVSFPVNFLEIDRRKKDYEGNSRLLGKRRDAEITTKTRGKAGKK
jgi:hypothetical protein